MAETTSPTRLQLKITLDNLEPPIWRRVVVRDDLSFAQLHKVIQAAMGWEDCHLHQFELASPRLFIGTQSKDDPFSGESTRMLPERTTRLAEVLERKRKFRYWYDFGDDWWHTIAIEKRLPAEADGPAAELLEGERACPPEDCGGPWGYAEMLAAVTDPAHPEHEDIREWLGDFDATAVDLAALAKRVKSAVRKGRGS
jgi:pRiA4b ORF-3-like protein